MESPHYRSSGNPNRSASTLRSFISLESNWDTYGAVTPSDETISRVVAFIRKADRYLTPVYFVAPGPNGKVVVEFRRNDREAAVYFNPDGTTEVVVSEGNTLSRKENLKENYEDLLPFIMCIFC